MGTYHSSNVFMIVILLIISSLFISGCRHSPYSPPETFVSVPGGTFIMGTDDHRKEDGPAHSRTVTSFYMEQTELTNKVAAELLNYGLKHKKIRVHDDQVFVNSRNSPLMLHLTDMDFLPFTPPIEYHDGMFSALSEYQNHPLFNVTWYGAAMLCNLRSLSEGLKPAYNEKNWTLAAETNTYRLPTETEWEYAAGGGPVSEGFPYSGSADINEVAWYGGNSSEQAHPAAQLKPNRLGIYDMSGNLTEWCSTWDYPYPVSSEKEAYENRKEQHRMSKGGSWIYHTGSCKIIFRYRYEPGKYSSKVGLRMVYIPKES